MTEEIKIKKIKIPSHLKNVVIAKSCYSAIQATGFDDKNRKQYIYHPVWNIISDMCKYWRLKSFIVKLPIFMKKIASHAKIIKTGNVSKNQVLAFMFQIMFNSNIRVGNKCYANENKTYGLTTLHKKHLIIVGKKLAFDFTGKSNVHHTILITGVQNLIPILEKMYKLPGKHLFQYQDKTKIHRITSEDMNKYIAQNMGNFTCKDIRTYGANILFIDVIRKEECPSNKLQIHKNIKNSLQKAADKLGHRLHTTKNSYVLKFLWDEYQKNPSLFHKYRQSSDKLLLFLLNRYFSN